MIKEFKRYYNTGELLETFFEDEEGFPHGICKIFDRDGSVTVECVFIKMIGWNNVCRRIYADGYEPSTIGSYKENFKNGINIDFHYFDGDKPSRIPGIFKTTRYGKINSHGFMLNRLYYGVVKENLFYSESNIETFKNGMNNGIDIKIIK